MSKIVFVLVLLGYNQVPHEVTSVREMSWHMSNSDCRTALADEEANGRSSGYNHQYVCMRVEDSQMYARLKAGQYNSTYPRKNGSGTLLLEWN